MRNSILLLLIKLQHLLSSDEGQDVVEYSLLVAVISLTCIVGVSHMATAVNKLFGHIRLAIP
jgi:Flp pilus assembly pilin Flp